MKLFSKLTLGLAALAAFALTTPAEARDVHFYGHPGRVVGVGHYYGGPVVEYGVPYAYDYAPYNGPGYGVSVGFGGHPWVGHRFVGGEHRR